MGVVPVLIVGGEGTIGGALWRRFHGEGRWTLVVTSRNGAEGTVPLDLADDVSSFALPPGLEIAFLCAAVTDLVRCEEAPAESAMINVEHTIELAARLLEMGAFVLFPSTNLVFDGTAPLVDAATPTSPTTEYGRQKAEAERRLLALGDEVAVLRLTKVVHPDLPLFRDWRRKLLVGKAIRPFSDLLFSPVPLERAVESLLRIARRRVGGIFQLSADRDVSYEAAARWLAASLDADPALICPRRAMEVGIPVVRITPHTTLDGSRLARQLAIEPPVAEGVLGELFAVLAQEAR